MGLSVALDDNQAAAGELFWDDGDSIGTVLYLYKYTYTMCRKSGR